MWTRFLVGFGFGGRPVIHHGLGGGRRGRRGSGRGPQMHHFRILRLRRLQQRGAKLGPAVFERGALIFEQRGIVASPASWAVSETRSSTS